MTPLYNLMQPQASDNKDPNLLSYSTSLLTMFCGFSLINIEMKTSNLLSMTSASMTQLVKIEEFEMTTMASPKTKGPGYAEYITNFFKTAEDIQRTLLILNDIF